MDSSIIKILFAGDLALTGSAESLDGVNYSLRLDNSIREIFNSTDLNIVNLETPLTRSKTRIIKTGENIKSDPNSVNLLKDLNISLACLSNNHIRDFDDAGVLETIAICNENDISVVGAGINLAQAKLPFIKEIKSLKIGVLNFSETEFNDASEYRAGSNPADPINVWNGINSVRKEVDFLIVIVHGGKEYYNYPTPELQKLFHFIIDLGADIIIGHHPHVKCGYEFYSGKPIIYSLGNFIFDEPGNSPEWYNGALTLVELSQSKTLSLKFIGVELSEGTIAVTKVQDPAVLKSSDSVLAEINESDVPENWERLIKANYKKSLEYFLRRNRIRRLLGRLGLLKSYSKDELKFLLSLHNRLTCRTHSEFLEGCINLIIDNRTEK